MTTIGREVDSWLSAILDFLLAVLGFVVVWYPMVSLGNVVLGSPISEPLSNLLVGVLVFGSSYPVVAGDWSLGQLGEYVFALLVAVLGWGIVGAVAVLAWRASFSGSNPGPQAAVWAAAYLTAYVVVYKTQWSISR